MHLAAPQPDVLPQGDAAVVPLRRAAQGALQRGGAASVGPVMAVLQARKPGKYAVEKGFRSV